MSDAGDSPIQDQLTILRAIALSELGAKKEALLAKAAELEREAAVLREQAECINVQAVELITRNNLPHRRCTDCGIFHSLLEFSVTSIRGKPVIRTWCNSCLREYYRVHGRMKRLQKKTPRE